MAAIAAQPQGIEVNVGRCVDWSEVRNNPQGGQGPVVGNGWRITGIFQAALMIGDDRYMIRSNFGNGPDTDIIFPGSVTNMYDCPGNGAAGAPGAGAGANAPGGNNAAANNNVEMVGGRKRRRQVKRKARKSRKARKASKKTRKH